MKKALKIVLVMSLCIPAITNSQNRITKEEKWQKTKEVLLSGEVAYGLLGLVLAGIGIRSLWAWWNQRKERQCITQQLEDLKPKALVLLGIIKKEDDKESKETAIKEFCEQQLKFQEDTIACSFDKNKRTLTVRLMHPELIKNPDLKKFYSILRAGTIDDPIALGDSERTLSDEDVVTKITVIV